MHHVRIYLTFDLTAAINLLNLNALPLPVTLDVLEKKLRLLFKKYEILLFMLRTRADYRVLESRLPLVCSLD